MIPTLAACKVVVDVQHLFREGLHAGDRGSLYRLKTGGSVWEGDCALHYALAATNALRGMGATVVSNDPRNCILTGPYSRRQAAAVAIGAHVYLACHLNAGGGTYTLCEHMKYGPAAPLARSISEHVRQAFPNVIDHAAVVALGDTDRGAVCVRGFPGHAVTVEPLFGDNLAHQALLTLDALNQIGSAIAQGVSSWWQSRPVPPEPPRA